LVFCLDFSQLNITMSAGRLRTSHRSVYLHAMDLALRTGLTTCLENLEMSGNLTAVREMTGILLTVMEVSGKNLVREKWPKIVYCKLHICVHS